MEEIAEIAAKAAQGDNKAFESLYQLTKQGVWFTCISLLKNEENARDAMQNTYLAAFEKLDTLTEPKGVQSWLNKVAANKCRDYMRKAYVNKEQEDVELVENISDEGLTPEEYVVDRAKRRAIMELVEKALTEEQYQTIILYYFAEMTATEIAGLMGCHEKTVQYRLKTARVRIKEAVLSYEGKNGEKLHGIAPIPLILQLLKAEASDAAVPEGFDAHLLDVLKDVFKNHGRKAAGGKGKRTALMNTVKAKGLLGVLGGAAALGAVTAVILLNHPGGGNHGEGRQNQETAAAATDRPGEGAEENRLTSLIKVNGVEFDLFNVTIGRMMSEAGVDPSATHGSLSAAACDYEDGTIEAFDGKGFSNGIRRIEQIDDTHSEVHYDTQMYVAAMVDGHMVDSMYWMDYTLTPEAYGDFQVKGIEVSDEITLDKSFVQFCGGICLGMSKEDIDAILGSGYDIPMKIYDADSGDGDDANREKKDITESHYRTSELTMVIRYDGADEAAAAYSIRFYVNGSGEETLPKEEIADSPDIGGKQAGSPQNASEGPADGEGGSADTKQTKGQAVGPLEEIENVGFDSGLVQVYNELFLQGGYMTVAEFIEKYEDTYHFKYSNGANYGSNKQFTVLYTKPHNYDYSYHDKKYTLKMYPMTEDGKYDTDYKITVDFVNMTSPDELIPIEEALVVGIHGTLTWFPGGFIEDSVPESEPGGLRSANTAHTRDSLKALLDELGYEEYREEQRFEPEPDNYGKYCVYEESIVLLVAGEPNLAGETPVYSYTFWIDPDTGSLTNQTYFDMYF